MALSGCYVISAETSGQLEVIGEVEVTTVTCFSNGTTCPDLGNSGNTPPPFNVQIMLAYRVPDGVTAPASITSSGGAAITVTQDASYTSELQGGAPPPAGQHWVGYLSDASVLSSPGDITFKPRFGLPQGAGGMPFRGPFRFRGVTGARSTTGPVDCGPDPFLLFPGFNPPALPSSNQTICIDSPSPAETATDREQATRDLGITAAGTGTVRQNTSGAIPFTLEFAGAASPDATFDLSTATDAPGVTFAALPPLAPASDSTNAVDVVARVSPTTPQGTYDVTLTAALPNGQKRVRTGKLVVDLGAPANLSLPVVTGVGAVGKTLTCEHGDWSSEPTGYAYQWTRAGQPIAGATAQTYVLTEADGATIVSCTVRATNSVGTGEAKAGGLRAAQHGGADVDLGGKAGVSKSFVLTPGVEITCPPRLPVNCGGSTRVDADSGAAGAVQSAAVRAAKGPFAVQSGQSSKLTLRLTRAGRALLTRRGSLRLTATVRTRNHMLERVTSRKVFTVRAPR
jgi:hypothetical protein